MLFFYCAINLPNTAKTLSIENTHLLRKELGAAKAVEVLCKLRRLVNVLPVDDGIIDQALAAGFRDFEDAIQYRAALAGGVRCLVTRNGRDYPDPVIPVWTAEEFLSQS